MAIWPKTIQDRPLASIFALVAASSLVAAFWGLAAGVSVAVLTVAGFAVYEWRRRVKDRPIRHAGETFSFADVGARMRAKDEARYLDQADRREALVLARRREESEAAH